MSMLVLLGISPKLIYFVLLGADFSAQNEWEDNRTRVPEAERVLRGSLFVLHSDLPFFKVTR